MREAHLALQLDQWAEAHKVPPAEGAKCPCGLEKYVCSATCVGTAYTSSKVRILFVGKDHGWDCMSRDARQSQEWFEAEYREPKNRLWTSDHNRHLRRCVSMAAEILGSGCHSECDKKCGLKPRTDCVLCLFAKGNVVRCVEKEKRAMPCTSGPRIRACIRYLFRQLRILKPDVIIVQGRNKGSGHIHMDFRNELANWGRLNIDDGEVTGTAIWKKFDGWNGSTQIAFFVHPSARGRSSGKAMLLEEQKALQLVISRISSR